MKTEEFLILVLETHGQTLQRLSVFFGEENFLEILENAGENSPSALYENFHLDPNWFQEPKIYDSSSPYMKIENAVHELKLPSVLEFHLWAYPFYRKIIEEVVDLKLEIKTTPPTGLETLIQKAIEYSEKWIRSLSIPPTVSAAAEQAAHVPWIRFRSQALKKAGLRTLGLV